jgi:hypothetical protein
MSGFSLSASLAADGPRIGGGVNPREKTLLEPRGDFGLRNLPQLLPDPFQFGMGAPAGRTPVQVRGDAIPFFTADLPILVRGKFLPNATAVHLNLLFSRSLLLD